MTNEDKIIKVKSTRHINDGIGFSLGTSVLVIFCIFLIILSTFSQINITHFIIPAKLFTAKNLVFSDFLYSYKYIPQVPIILFLAVLLGRKYGIAAILLYIITGLFFVPVFALGGGLRYIFEFGFGYILGYIPAVFFAGSILKSGYSNRNLLHATFVGVLAIHFIGVLYMLIIALLRHEGWIFMQSWIVAQSGVKILYDFVFSFFAMFLAKYLRLVIWAYI